MALERGYEVKKLYKGKSRFPEIVNNDFNIHCSKHTNNKKGCSLYKFHVSQILPGKKIMMNGICSGSKKKNSRNNKDVRTFFISPY